MSCPPPPEVTMTMNHPASKCWLLLCALCIVLPAAKPVVAAEPAGEPPQRVKIELWLAEISVDKIRKVNFEWESLRTAGATRVDLADVFTSLEKAQGAADFLPGEGLTDLLGMLEKYQLAHILAQPTLTTQSGRYASFETGPVKLEATPTIKEDGRIHLAYNFQNRRPAPAGNRKASPGSETFFSKNAVDLNPGKTALAIPAFTPNKLILLVRASIDKPANDAEGTISRKSSLTDAVPSKLR
jgi:hypothetical protein